MSITNTGGGLVDQLKIDPSTGKPYSAAGKVSGTDIDSVRGKVKTVAKTDTVEATPTTTVVVQGTPGRGIAGAEITNRHLILTFTDGTSYDAGIVDGSDGNDGVSVTSATVNGSGHLILSKSNNTTVDAGLVRGTDGEDGEGFIGAVVDTTGHLILTPTTGPDIDLGVVRGTAGSNGKTILSGTGAPAPEVGTNGDFYLDTASMLIYGPKTTGAWDAGTLLKGTDGLNGKTVLSGAGAPAGGLGVNGDFYIDTTAVAIYGPKGTPSAGWNTATSLKGADGFTAPDVADLVELTEATDEASTMALTNAMRDLLISLGLAKSA